MNKSKNLGKSAFDSELVERSGVNDLPSEIELYNQIMLKNELVWGDIIDKKDVEYWLSNFKGEVFDINYERKLALLLLANFVFYNENEVRHLCKNLYREFLHLMIEEQKSKSKDLLKIIESIHSKSCFQNLGLPGESGGYLLYYFRQENKLPLLCMQESSSTENIIFVDDVTISGKQAMQYIERDGRKDEKRELLLTLISTYEAINLLKSHNIHVISSIVLDDRSKCFSMSSGIFHYFQEHQNKCKIFAKHYGKKLFSKHPLGYKSGEYAFGFYYNTPVNALPIFWSKANGWIPILKRYSKKIRGIPNEFGTFI